MRIRNLIILIGIVLIFSAAVVEMKLSPTASIFSALDTGFHYSGFFETKELVQKSLEIQANHQDSLSASMSVSDTDIWVQAGVTSHHLPTAVSFIAEFYTALKNSKGARGTFVILGPDHFERCSADISTSKRPWITPFGELVVDKEIVDELVLAGANIESPCLEGEHAIGIQTIFIKYLFPEAKVVPITFSADTQNIQLERMVDALEEFKDKITVICSTDFSHTYPKPKADYTDSQSEQMLKALDGDSFFLEYIDSPPAIKLTIDLAKRFYPAKTVILGRANSSDFDHYEKNTTGYINALFINKIYEK